MISHAFVGKPPTDDRGGEVCERGSMVVLALFLSLGSAPPHASEFIAFPDEAPGLVSASPTLGRAGRNFARAPVVATILDAAASLQASNHVFVLADVGLKGGGKMLPHATHRDGRSVDILMPVVDDKGAPTRFPHSDDDGFGYCARFDADGKLIGTGWEGKRPVKHPNGNGPLCKESNEARPFFIDFGAVARLVAAIESAGAKRGLRVKQVVVAPEYVDKVLASDDGKKLDARVRAAFERKPVWTRHDDHMHIELAPTK